MSLTKQTRTTTPILIAEAAGRIGRSVSWIRTWRASGQIEATEIDGRHAVTLESLLDFAAVRPRPRRRPKLHLVVDNTKTKP